MRNFIGLESNTIRIDIHESKIPSNMKPKFVVVYHNDKRVHKGKINFDNRTGEALIDLRFSKDKFDEIFNSTGRFLPFIFKFMTNSKKTARLLHYKGIKITKSVSIVVDGYVCKNGMLCGYIRKYGIRSRDNSIYICNDVSLKDMVYFGYHEGLHCKPIGPTYKMLFGGSILVSEHGKFSGYLSYIYKNTNFALMGYFDEYSNLIEGQKVLIKKQQCTKFGLRKFEYYEPLQSAIVYHYKPPNVTSFGDQPNIPDEIAVEYLTIKDSPNALVCNFNMITIICDYLKYPDFLKIFKSFFRTFWQAYLNIC